MLVRVKIMREVVDTKIKGLTPCLTPCTLPGSLETGDWGLRSQLVNFENIYTEIT